MAAPQTQTFTSLLENAVAAVQGASRQLLDFTVGSVLRAVIESTCALALWLQAEALQIASLTRFSTSSGADADSWAADFAFERLAAQSATGPVLFARFTSTQQATLNVGQIVQTADGTQKFAVIADTSQPSFDSTQNAYILQAGISEVLATVSAVVPGSAGNVQVGFINTLGSAIPGVDTVTNLVAFTNGADAEPDAAFKARFVLYIQSLSKATPAAISAAIESVQQDVTNSLTENQMFDGTADPGNFYAVVDDGSGSPSASFLSGIANAIDLVRPIGSTFQVFGPTLIQASVQMSLTIAAGYNQAQVDGLVQSAVEDYIASLS